MRDSEVSEITKINGEEYYVNPDLIEYIEVANETMVCLTNGKHLNVREHPDEVINRIIEYRKRVFTNLPSVLGDSPRLLGE